MKKLDSEDVEVCALFELCSTWTLFGWRTDGIHCEWNAQVFVDALNALLQACLDVDSGSADPRPALNTLQQYLFSFLVPKAPLCHAGGKWWYSSQSQPHGSGLSKVFCAPASCRLR